jgi:hypothetical protein
MRWWFIKKTEPFVNTTGFWNSANLYCTLLLIPFIPRRCRGIYISIEFGHWRWLDSRSMRASRARRPTLRRFCSIVSVTPNRRMSTTRTSKRKRSLSAYGYRVQCDGTREGQVGVAHPRPCPPAWRRGIEGAQPMPSPSRCNPARPMSSCPGRRW